MPILSHFSSPEFTSWMQLCPSYCHFNFFRTFFSVYSWIFSWFFFFFLNFWTFLPSLYFCLPFSKLAIFLPEERGISDKWVNPRSLVLYLMSFTWWTFVYPKLAYKVHENRKLMRKYCSHDFECFPLFTWLRIQSEWRTLAFLLVEVARNWKHKGMQNENKLARSFEAKNNLVCRVWVLAKGSRSGAGKYLICY